MSSKGVLSPRLVYLLRERLLKEIPYIQFSALFCVVFVKSVVLTYCLYLLNIRFSIFVLTKLVYLDTYTVILLIAAFVVIYLSNCMYVEFQN